MREFKREVSQTIHEWKAEVAKERDALSQKEKKDKNKEKTKQEEDEEEKSDQDEGNQKCC